MAADRPRLLFAVAALHPRALLEGDLRPETPTELDLGRRDAAVKLARVPWWSRPRVQERRNGYAAETPAQQRSAARASVCRGRRSPIFEREMSPTQRLVLQPTKCTTLEVPWSSPGGSVRRPWPEAPGLKIAVGTRAGQQRQLTRCGGSEHRPHYRWPLCWETKRSPCADPGPSASRICCRRRTRSSAHRPSSAPSIGPRP